MEAVNSAVVVTSAWVKLHLHPWGEDLLISTFAGWAWLGMALLVRVALQCRAGWGRGKKMCKHLFYEKGREWEAGELSFSGWEAPQTCATSSWHLPCKWVPLCFGGPMNLWSPRNFRNLCSKSQIKEPIVSPINIECTGWLRVHRRDFGSNLGALKHLPGVRRRAMGTLVA